MNAAIDRYIISHNVYYVQSDPQVAGTALASAIGPASAWSLIVRDRNLMLSAANLGQLARQLVAIDALSYVQSQ